MDSYIKQESIVSLGIVKESIGFMESGNVPQPYLVRLLKIHIFLASSQEEIKY